ncbi:MAG: DUF1524 domain-containing protein [Chloroflexota bacterium]
MTHLLFALLLTITSTLTSVSGAAPTVRISLITALNRLNVQPEHLGGYVRSKFGGWVDADHDGLDTRAEVLVAESIAPVTITYHTVRTGKWVSLYDHVTWTNASDVDIDHVVALSEAWKSGAFSWSPSRRVNYANDISVTWALRAVTDNVNMFKGDKDPSEWIPSYRAAVCTYLVDWVAVKLRWGLSVNPTEKSSIASSWRSAGCSSRVSPPRVDVRIAP